MHSSTSSVYKIGVMIDDTGLSHLPSLPHSSKNLSQRITSRSCQAARLHHHSADHVMGLIRPVALFGPTLPANGVRSIALETTIPSSSATFSTMRAIALYGSLDMAHTALCGSRSTPSKPLPKPFRIEMSFPVDLRIQDNSFLGAQDRHSTFEQLRQRKPGVEHLSKASHQPTGAIQLLPSSSP